MHYVPDPEERKKIIARLRGNPWDGFFEASVADSLKNKYGFSPEFDLASRLSEALWRYRNRDRASPGPFSSSEMESGRIESISTAMHVGLWKAHNQREYTRRSMGDSVLVAAKRFFSGKSTRGTKLDLRTVSLIRTLGAIYQDGTGKKISLAHSRSGFRGASYKFLVEACSKMGVSLSKVHIREMAFRTFSVEKTSSRGTRRQKAKEVRKEPNVCNIMNRWIKN